eukprot:scaffold2663_cov353-Prasinococcus_capsulatus_cf.AAC.7
MAPKLGAAFILFHFRPPAPRPHAPRPRPAGPARTRTHARRAIRHYALPWRRRERGGWMSSERASERPTGGGRTRAEETDRGALTSVVRGRAGGRGMKAGGATRGAEAFDNGAWGWRPSRRSATTPDRLVRLTGEQFTGQAARAVPLIFLDHKRPRPSGGLLSSVRYRYPYGCVPARHSRPGERG